MAIDGFDVEEDMVRIKEDVGIELRLVLGTRWFRMVVSLEAMEQSGHNIIQSLLIINASGRMVLLINASSRCR